MSTATAIVKQQQGSRLALGKEREVEEKPRAGRHRGREAKAVDVFSQKCSTAMLGSGWGLGICLGVGGQLRVGMSVPPTP